MQQQYDQNMVNNTDDNDPTQEQQNENRPASTVNHITQELHDNDALKEKLKTYLTLTISTSLKEK